MREAVVLEEGVADHREQRVMMQPRPAPAFEVIEPQLFLHLLM
jgi:hypothetical protein